MDGGAVMRIWDKDSERGALLGAIGAIVLFTFIFPDPDVDLGVSYPGNPPYGPIWFLFNPFYWTKRLYPMIVFAEWALVTLFEWHVLPKYRGLVKLQIMSVAFLFMIHAVQDVTVIMFAPLMLFNPIMYLLLEIFQKFPLPSTPQWTCAFGGNSTSANVYQNPCLSTGTKFFIFSPHVYSLTYILLIFWAVYPLVLWWKMRRGSGKLGSVVGVERKRLQHWLSWGLWKEKGVAEKKYSLTPTIRTQPAIPSPTKSVSRLDILLLLTLGVCAHDIASIYGFHIPGYHAIYFAVPMIVVILSIKFERRVRRKK